MIPLVAEPAAVAKPETKPSDASKQTAPSVDKFADHFRTLAKPVKKPNVTPPRHRVMNNHEAPSPRAERPDRPDIPSPDADPVEGSPAPVESVDSERKPEEATTPSADTTPPLPANPYTLHVCGWPSDQPMPVEPLAEEVATTELTIADELPETLTLAATTSLSSQVQEAPATPTTSSDLPPEAIVALAATEPSLLEVTNSLPAPAPEPTLPEQASAPTSAQQDAAATSLAAAASEVASSAVEVALKESEQGHSLETATQVRPQPLPEAGAAEAAAIELPKPVSETPRNRPSAKQAITTTFAQYLFGESQSTAAVAPPPEVTALMDALGKSGSPDQSDEAEESSGGKETAAEIAQQRAESVTVLSPADAAQAAASTLPTNLRRHIESHGTGIHAARPSTPVSDAQQARLMQRVTRAFRAAEEGGGEVRIRLSPPELGSMKLELSLASGVMTAKVEVETRQAQSILVDNLSTLRDRLAEQGIRVEKFDVSLQQRDTGGQQPQQQQQPSPERTPRSSAAARRAVEEAAAGEPATRQRPLAGSSRLNVII